jgi:hypothetical protein
LTVAYVLLDIVFVILIFRNRQEVLKLQYCMLSVLVLVTAETLSWSIAFTVMNDTGTPACCPYPSVLVAAVILQMLRKTMCRVLLLVVCLGLGMVYPSLEKKQTILVSLLGVVSETCKIASGIYSLTIWSFTHAGVSGVRAG